MAFKIRQNPFSAGSLPRTPLGELTTLPRPTSRLKSGYPSPYHTPFGTDPPSALAMRPPQNSSQIYACQETVVSGLRRWRLDGRNTNESITVQISHLRSVSFHQKPLKVEKQIATYIIYPYLLPNSHSCPANATCVSVVKRCKTLSVFNFATRQFPC